MGFSDIMRQRLFGPMSDRYAEYSDLIHESGAHLLELINDVLDMSKIEAERFELAREDFDARDAIAAVLRLMRGQADRAGISLKGELSADSLEAEADRRAIKQIAFNLVSNALKFTPRGGSVTVSAGPALRTGRRRGAEAGGRGAGPVVGARLRAPARRRHDHGQHTGRRYHGDRQDAGAAPPG
jgi:cell cycle sensor histidine kinase DivJ